MEKREAWDQSPGGEPHPPAVQGGAGAPGERPLRDSVGPESRGGAGVKARIGFEI